MAKSRSKIKDRLEEDENFMMKIMSEVGDIARLVLRLIERMDKLERRMDKYETN